MLTLATRGRLYHPVCAQTFKISQETAGIGPDSRRGWGSGKTWQLPSGAYGWSRVGVGHRRKLIWWSHLKYISNHINTTTGPLDATEFSLLLGIKRDETDVATINLSFHTVLRCFPYETSAPFKQTTSSGAQLKNRAKAGTRGPTSDLLDWI